MNILIIGAGGREHALAWKCKSSPKVRSLQVTPGNGGIEAIADCWYLTEHEAIVKKAQERNIDLVIVGQEDYLVHGLKEQLEEVGISVFGPSQKAAMLEGSKVFSKSFMKKQGIPTAAYQTFSETQPAKKFLTTLSAPYVIKADGLAAGKGAILCDSLEEAENTVDAMLVEKQFGSAGDQIIIEEFLKGEEASFFVISDGKNYITLPSLQDHKRQLELDCGPNTGGMGCYSPAPVVTAKVEKSILSEIVEPTLQGMREEGTPYMGVLYIGLMIEDEKPRVIEYNIRFGDPECQPLMMLLQTDFIELAEATIQKKLGNFKTEWYDGAAATVVLASAGYPKAYENGVLIQGLHDVKSTESSMVFHAGTKKRSDHLLTNGGRVLGVTVRSKNLHEALRLSYEQVTKISWPGMQFRRDIGIKGIKRIHKMKNSGVKVGIIMGSASDVKIAREVTVILSQFEIEYDVIVSSAHRTPERTRKFIKDVSDKGGEVIIAIAGMAAHLPGVVASETILPVIGVPVNGTPLSGQDALYSIVQMPPGIPVATVGLNAGKNAGLLAIQILSIKYKELKAMLQEYRISMEKKVIKSNQDLEI